MYLKEIEKSDIYLLLVGNKYGYSKEGEVRNSLRDIMLDDGILSDKPFEDQCPADASLDDIDARDRKSVV